VSASPGASGSGEGPQTYELLLTQNTVCSGPIDPERVPVMIPADQAYYWTAEWQAGERESAEERAAGRSVVFDGSDPDDVIRWLSR
jgi:hypothetical protein